MMEESGQICLIYSTDGSLSSSQEDFLTSQAMFTPLKVSPFFCESILVKCHMGQKHTSHTHTHTLYPAWYSRWHISLTYPTLSVDTERRSGERGSVKDSGAPSAAWPFLSLWTLFVDAKTYRSTLTFSSKDGAHKGYLEGPTRADRKWRERSKLFGIERIIGSSFKKQEGLVSFLPTLFWEVDLCFGVLLYLVIQPPTQIRLF